MVLRAISSRRVAAVAATLALVMPAVLWSRPAGAGPATTTTTATVSPSVTLTPNVGLVDFQPVQIGGSGFEPSTLYEWFQCRGGAVSASDCDGYNADFIDSDASGNVSGTVYVDARIYLPDGTEVDCRTDPAGCEIGVGFMADAGSWPEAHLNFDAMAPLRPVVTATVTPSGGLVNDQTVTVQGQNLSFREEMWVYLCAPGTTMPGRRCDIDRAARSVPDQQGDGTVQLKVRPRFNPPLGGSIDCAAAGAGCYVQVGWSFDPAPDRRARVPIAFAASSTTTTTVPPPVTPPPANPVDGRPSFTG